MRSSRWEVSSASSQVVAAAIGDQHRRRTPSRQLGELAGRVEQPHSPISPRARMVASITSGLVRGADQRARCAEDRRDDHRGRLAPPWRADHHRRAFGLGRDPLPVLIRHRDRRRRQESGSRSARPRRSGSTARGSRRSRRRRRRSADSTRRRGACRAKKIATPQRTSIARRTSQRTGMRPSCTPR